MSGGRNGTNVVLDSTDIPGFQRADVYDHIHFPCAVKDRAAGFVCLHVRQRRPKREADDSTNRYAASLQEFSGPFDPAGINADGGKSELGRLRSEERRV